MGLPTAIVVRMRRRPDASTSLWHHRRVDVAALLSSVQPLVPARVFASAIEHGLAGRVATGLVAIRARWPAGPAVTDVGPYLAERLSAPRDLAIVASLRIDDLYLAWWTQREVVRGIAAFSAAFAGDVQRVARQFPASPPRALRAVLHAALFTGTAAGPPRIRSYTGFGFLRAWLQVTAARVFVELARAQPTEHCELAAP